MQTVWIVYEQDYGDSCNRGVFSTLEKAEQFVSETRETILPIYQRPHLVIETWEVDVPT